METNIVEKKMSIVQLTKNFIRANQKILHQDRFYHEIRLYGTINAKINIENPIYITISEGKAMQKNDIANFAKDFTKSTQLAKLKITNGQTANTE